MSDVMIRAEGLGKRYVIRHERAPRYTALRDVIADKVEELGRRVAQKMGFERLYGVTGQTYPRKSDYAFLAGLAGIAASASKCLSRKLRRSVGMSRGFPSRKMQRQGQ